MSRLFGCVFGSAVALTVSLAAQDPAPAKPPTGSAPDRRAATAPMPEGMVTIEGCVMKEVDVPGRQPPEAMRQRAEADNDFVLTRTKVIKGTAPKSTGAPAATPAAMYEIQGLEKGVLTKHAGQRVQIDGAFENTDRISNPVSFATDLVDLRGTAIRPVGGECGAK
jgi:hypothetical protein